MSEEEKKKKKKEEIIMDELALGMSTLMADVRNLSDRVDRLYVKLTEYVDEEEEAMLQAMLLMKMFQRALEGEIKDEKKPSKGPGAQREEGTGANGEAKKDDHSD